MARSRSYDGEDIGGHVGELADNGRLPTDEERATLRLVSASVPWAAYVIAIVEFGE